MRDGRTRKLKNAERRSGIEEYLSRFVAKLVAVSGRDAGKEFQLGGERLTLGRGPGVDLAFENSAMSRQHAVIEYASEGFRIRDLGSTNGIQLNGRPVQAGELKHGDCVTIGGQEFQVTIEESEGASDAYELSLD